MKTSWEENSCSKKNMIENPIARRMLQRYGRNYLHLFCDIRFHQDSLRWLETEAGVVKREEITVALLALVGHGEAKEAIFLWVCVRERILLLL
jgi:hypothetical protein